VYATINYRDTPSRVVVLADFNSRTWPDLSIGRMQFKVEIEARLANLVSGFHRRSFSFISQEHAFASLLVF
jgi:hypothetical protein